MKAVVCARPGEIGVQDWPVPEVREGIVVVNVQRIGLCGTD